VPPWAIVDEGVKVAFDATKRICSRVDMGGVASRARAKVECNRTIAEQRRSPLSYEL
jgi:hypothetical protein